MNSREKKLLGLVIVALILAAGNFFYSSLDKFDAVVSSDSKAEAASSAVAQMSARMASMPLNAEARRRLAAANEPLKRDPLQAVPASRQFARNGQKLPFISVDGLIHMGRTHLVILGGVEFARGDMIPETGEVVKSIGADSVVLELPDTGMRRTLNFVEQDLQTNYEEPKAGDSNLTLDRQAGPVIE